MAQGINEYVEKLHRYEKKREDFRVRLATEDLNDGERGRLDGEIAVVNSQIEYNARLINDELREYARRGYAPSPPSKLDEIKDPELKSFCAEVKKTLTRI